MRSVAGIDGGGTHTRAVIADERGNELGRAEAGGAVVTVSGSEAAAGTVAEAVRAAVAAAGVELPLKALWAGLAGAGAREGRMAVTRALHAAGLAEWVHVGTDVEAAFHDAFAERPGILLISGTGSVAWARSPEGRIVRVGGWGERLGDEGSGYAIGLAALRAVARAEDGRGAPTRLAPRVLERLSLAAPDELVGWASRASKGDVAALVPVVAVEAAGGDAVAAGILDRAVADLSAHLAAAVQRTGTWSEPPELVLWGGLLQKGGALRASMEEALAAYPVRFVDREIDPAMGAVRLALRDVDGSRAEA